MVTTGAERWRALVWLGVCACAGVALLLLFDDGCQQDGGLHFLFAKWAWKHPGLFVGVWSRPLYTTLYAVPALAGYRVARAVTVVICLAVSWQSYRLASDLRLERASLAVVLVWLQPSLFLFAADNMTEPVFALVCVIGLRLHLAGRRVAGMAVASLTILARPEGFFLGLLWAWWFLRGEFGAWSEVKSGWRRGLKVLWLGLGAGIWWLAALLLTRDPLFILHNWPQNWPLTGTVYGAAGLLAYPARLPEIVGPFLLVPFAIGVWRLWRQRSQMEVLSIFLLFIILHTILRAWGMLGSAGYPRYLVTISPVIAVITLVGWNRVAWRLREVGRPLRLGLGVLVVVISGYLNFVYADGAEWSRDARALEQVCASARPAVPVTRLIWNEPYVCILYDRDPWENPAWTGDRERDLAELRRSPVGTLVVWDRLVGPKWFGLSASDFEEAGFRRLYEESFVLEGYILDRSWFGFGGPRRQTYAVLQKTE